MVTAEELRGLEAALNQTSNPWDRLPLLVKLSECYGDTDPPSAQKPAMEANHLAKSLKDPHWLAQSYYAIGQSLVGQDKFSETLYYLRQASEPFKKLGDSFMLAKTNHFISRTYMAMGCTEEAITTALHNQQFFESVDNNYWLCRTLLTLGSCFMLVGDHAESLKVLRKGLQISSDSNFTYEEGWFWIRMGSLYRGINDRESEKEHIVKGVAILKSVNGKGALAFAFSTLSHLYMRTKENQNALKYATKARDLFQEMGYTARRAIEIGRIASVYGRDGEIMKSFAHHREAIRLLQTTENDIYLAYAYKNFALELYRHSRPQESLCYLEKALPIVEEDGDIKLKFQVYQLLAAVYQAEGIRDAINALKYYHLYVLTRDEYAGDEKQRAVKQEELRQKVAAIKSRAGQPDNEDNKQVEGVVQKETELLSFMMALTNGEKSPSTAEYLGKESPKNQEGFSPVPVAESSKTLARLPGKGLHKFFFALVKTYPQLTSTEVKVCSLIRYGLSSKEIAAQLCVSKRTIDNHRENIRKKLKLPPRSSLAKFILSLQTQ